MPKMTIIYPSIRNDWMSKLADKSIERQTLKDIEVIKIDDPNISMAEATNIALDKATGELITWAMDDDIQMIEKCEILAMYADKYPEYDIFHAGHLAISKLGSLKRVRWPCDFDIEKFVAGERIVDSFTSAVRREKIGNVRFRGDFPRAQEFIFWYELYYKGLKFKRITLPVAIIREWGGTISSRYKQETLDEIEKARIEFSKGSYKCPK